jgi:Peptide N-acetyl-beta-D-glucosaminyl asparaginase amidase A
MRRLLAVLVAVSVAAIITGVAGAGEGVYYQDPVQADMPVSVPPTPSCTVTLATDYTTNTSSGAYQDYNGTFTPPAGCPGPWAKVVLHFSATEAGRQYDRENPGHSWLVGTGSSGSRISCSRMYDRLRASCVAIRSLCVPTR